MKIKNTYSKLCPIWIISTLLNMITAITKFVDGKISLGFIFFIVACGFAFVSGILLEKAIQIYQHNKACDFLEDIHEFLREKSMEQIEPFDEFKGDKK